jgi:serine protease Do
MQGAKKEHGTSLATRVSEVVEMGLPETKRAHRFAGAAFGASFLLLGGAHAMARATPDSFADLANRLLPSVVNISATEMLKPDPSGAAEGDRPSESLFGDLFKKFDRKSEAQPQRVAAQGSGFVIDSSGLIVTNDHVIDGAESITVTLNDGTNLPASIVGRDDKTDLALLRVESRTPLPAAHFGDSDRTRIGDWVMAIGNPFGLGSSVTAGVVSARNRDIAEGPYDDFIQTDAPINRGNSGGPLFDMDGNVVGVTSALYSPSGGSVGIGFAIPSNMARIVIAQLRELGCTRRGWIGVRVQPVTHDIAESLGLTATTGALVSEATSGGPAALAGVQGGDVITAFDGKAIADSRALPRLVAESAVGRHASIELFRKGQEKTFQVTVAQLETAADLRTHHLAAPAPKTAAPFFGLGLALAPLDGRLRAKYRLGAELSGVVITSVDPASPAEDRGLRPGDVILEVQNQSVDSPDEVSDRVAQHAKSGRKAVLFLLSRNGQTNYIALPLGDPG